MLRTIEDLLGMQPLGLNDGLQPSMTDIFTRDLKKWDYASVVPPVLRTTRLPLPAATKDEAQLESIAMKSARPAHDAKYWATKTKGFDFKHPDHLDPSFNRTLWSGMKGEDVPYPTKRSGRNLRKNRESLLAADSAKRAPAPAKTQ
jgi:hypothetical protein